VVLSNERRFPVAEEARSPVHEPWFLWFTRAGRAYLVADRASLARVGELHRRARPHHLGVELRELADELLRDGAAKPIHEGP
jgi:hypothetical protein